MKTETKNTRTFHFADLHAIEDQLDRVDTLLAELKASSPATVDEARDIISLLQVNFFDVEEAV